MADVVYTIVEHDGGWAYKLDGVFSETFPSRRSAEAAAARVAEEQRMPGETEAISWQDERGDWHDELESGDNRPNASVERSPADLPLYAAGGHFIPDQRDVHRARENLPLLLMVLVAAIGFLMAALGRSSRRR